MLTRKLRKPASNNMTEIQKIIGKDNGCTGLRVIGKSSNRLKPKRIAEIVLDFASCLNVSDALYHSIAILRNVS